MRGPSDWAPPLGVSPEPWAWGLQPAPPLMYLSHLDTRDGRTLRLARARLSSLWDPGMGYTVVTELAWEHLRIPGARLPSRPLLDWQGILWWSGEVLMAMPSAVLDPWALDLRHWVGLGARPAPGPRWM